MATLRNVLDDVASFINQDPTLVSGTDLTSQVNLINQSQNEWADAYQWKQLRYTYSPSFGLSATSLALRSNFKKLMSPVYDMSMSPYDEYQEINPSERFGKLSSDKYCYQYGNQADGQALIINPPLPSGASIVLEYQAYPSAAATLQDVMICPSRAYLTARTIAKILAARSDPRFPTFKVESDDLLANMIEEEAAPSGGMENVVPNYYKRINFRMGNS